MERELLQAEDAELMEKVRVGDDEAFEFIVRRYERTLSAYISARLLVPTDVDDLVQEVFIRAYMAVSRFHPGAPVRNWLCGIARHVLLEHLRKLKRRAEVSWTTLCLDLEGPTEPSEGDRFEEALTHLPDCIERLGPTAQQAIAFQYEGGEPQELIGKRLRRSAGAVKLLLHRARGALRDCLQKKMREDD